MVSWSPISSVKEISSAGLMVSKRVKQFLMVGKELNSFLWLVKS